MLIDVPRIDFSPELGLGDERFSDDTDISNTLQRLTNFVARHAGKLSPCYPGLYGSLTSNTTGVGEIAPAKKKKTLVTSVLTEWTGYKIQPADYRNRDGILFRKSDFTAVELDMYNKNILYILFRHAHGTLSFLPFSCVFLMISANISPYPAKEIEPPWAAIKRGELLDPMYLPDGVPFVDPTWMPKKHRLSIIDRVDSIGHLTFHHWKRRNGPPMEPVDFDQRIWAVQPGAVGAAAFDAAKAKALAARPTHHVREAPRGLGSAEPDHPAGGPAEPTSDPAGPRVFPAEPDASHAPPVISPYGSSRLQKFHSAFYWCKETEEEYSSALFPDPDDVVPVGADPEQLDAPCSVPDNPEAKAQWAIQMLSRPEMKNRAPVVALQTAVTSLAQLPVSTMMNVSIKANFLQYVPNHFYPARHFKKRNMYPQLPKALTWSSPSLDHLVQTVPYTTLDTFIRSTPWCYVQNAEEIFTGIEMSWLFVLGMIVHTLARPEGDDEWGMLLLKLSRIALEFRDYLWHINELYEYVGVGPSVKYAVAISRPAYLYSLCSNGPNLVELLEAVVRLVRLTLHAYITG